MRAARIENGLVADLWEVEALDCFEGVTLIEAPEHVEIGTTYDPATGFGPKPAQALERIELGARIERDARLAACDWTQLADAPLTSAQKTAWKTYRQALRDVTTQADFPASIVWPVAP